MAELDIAAFLRARLDEREAVALAATPGPWESEGDDPTDDEVYTVHDGEHGDLIGNVVAFARGGDRQQPNTVHIADNDPEFALADVAAKRRILALHEPTFPPDGPIHGVHWEHVHVRGANGEIIGDREFAVENDEPDPPDWCGQCAEGRCAPCPTLRLLALLYSGHPDYREEWR